MKLWKEKMKETVSNPAHYTFGKIEVIEALEDWSLDFHKANAVKYIVRAGKKDPNTEVEDLEKAIWYLRRKIEVLQASSEKRATLKPSNMNTVDASSDKNTGG
jgi:Protein of unknwon function (DUF3310)